MTSPTPPQSVEDAIKQQAKSAKAQLPLANESAANLPPHLVANFKGTYWKGGGKGTEAVHFEQEVKVPLSFLLHNNLTPIGIFKNKLANRVLHNLPGYNGVRTCRLVSCSELPEDLSLNQQLNWTARHAGLAAIAKTHTPIVEPSLWPDPNDLREAVRRCKQEPDVFIKEQEARKHGDFATHRQLEDDLAALGY